MTRRLIAVAISLFFSALSLVMPLRLAAQSLVIDAPELCENGAVCPYTLRATPPLQPGAKLKLTVDLEDVLGIEVIDGFLSEFSGRLMLNTQSSQLDVSCEGCTNVAARRVVKASLLAMPPSGNSPLPTKVSTASNRSGEFKALVDTSGMPPQGGYAFLDAIGLRVVVAISPRMSPNPFFGFVGSVQAGNSCFSIYTIQSMQKCHESERTLTLQHSQLVIYAAPEKRPFIDSGKKPARGDTGGPPGEQIKKSVDDARQKCTSLGFKLESEKFGECVLTLSK